MKGILRPLVHQHQIELFISSLIFSSCSCFTILEQSEAATNLSGHCKNLLFSFFHQLITSALYKKFLRASENLLKIFLLLNIISYYINFRDTFKLILLLNKSYYINFRNIFKLTLLLDISYYINFRETFKLILILNISYYINFRNIFKLTLLLHISYYINFRDTFKLILILNISYCINFRDLKTPIILMCMSLDWELSHLRKNY